MSDLAGIGGEIHVRLTDAGGRIGAVEIRSTRPVEAARLFEGKTAEEMCATIGRVFSLCGRAQTVAALEAVEQALGITPAGSVAAARSALRRAEIVTQIATRLALHWPRVLGLPLVPEVVRTAMAAEREIEARVLGPGWQVPGAALPGGTAAPARLDVTALVDPLAWALAARGIEGYGAAPDGTAPELGVFSTYWAADPVARARAAHGAGLAARLAAAETALYRLADQIRTDLDAVGPAPARSRSRDDGAGAARVDTARGPLLHRVEITAGRVTRCRTEAPTEPNFAPGGPVAVGLAGAAPDPVAAELHVLAIDPCVGCRLELAPG